jgi:hypothetical protein
MRGPKTKQVPTAAVSYPPTTEAARPSSFIPAVGISSCCSLLTAYFSVVADLVITQRRKND